MPFADFNAQTLQLRTTSPEPTNWQPPPNTKTCSVAESQKENRSNAHTHHENDVVHGDVTVLVLCAVPYFSASNDGQLKRRCSGPELGGSCGCECQNHTEADR